MKSILATGRLCLCGALVALAIPLHAAIQENDRTDIALSTFVPCAADGAGEIVDLAGPLHTLISFTISGGSVSGYFHFQPQGIVGRGETTGEVYHAVGITRESFRNALKNGQANDTFVNNFKIIGQRSENNLLIHETLHFTINTNGSVTVVHDNFSIVCH